MFPALSSASLLQSKGCKLAVKACKFEANMQIPCSQRCHSTPSACFLEASAAWNLPRSHAMRTVWPWLSRQKQALNCFGPLVDHQVKPNSTQTPQSIRMASMPTKSHQHKVRRHQPCTCSFLSIGCHLVSPEMR